MKAAALLIFTFIYSGSFSQKKFIKATLYKSDGSILECFIKNTAAESTQQQFEYTTEPSGKTTVIHAADINSISFEDGMLLEKHYLDLVVMDINPLERRIEDYEYPERRVTGWFMVEKIMTGPVSLFQFTDKYQFPHFFYKTSSDSSIQKLEYKVYVAPDTSVKPVQYYAKGLDLIYKRNYRNQILFLASNAGCGKKVDEDVNRLDYKLPGMIAVFKKINNCSGTVVNVHNKYLLTKPAIRFTVNGGAAATSLTIPSPSQSRYPGLTADAFSGSVSPLIGVSLEIVPQKRQQNYVVSLDLLYHSYSAKTDSLHPSSYITSVGQLKFSAFSISPSVRFRLTKSEIAPFLEFGAGLRQLASGKDYFYYRNSISGFSDKISIFQGKTGSMGLLGGGGIDFKKFSLHARYTMPAGKSSTYYSTVFLMGKFILAGKKN
jgi:hypothetical protein